MDRYIVTGWWYNFVCFEKKKKNLFIPPTFAEICASTKGARFALDQKYYSCTLDNSTENDYILFY